MGRAEYKVPGGKLLAAETAALEGRLTSVKVTGDFFMHPETAIEELEEHLTGIPLEEMEKAVENFFKGRGVALYGVASEDFSHVLRLSLGDP
ncbi:MAG: hypothetical protein JSV27_11420 [Candidatus Bathyarchaeota archaeon]|nr:MAG: hypothetical protein JSV27_11420 [Candidatus Bathyarchaeota archaeon]